MVDREQRQSNAKTVAVVSLTADLIALLLLVYGLRTGAAWWLPHVFLGVLVFTTAFAVSVIYAFILNPDPPH